MEYILNKAGIRMNTVEKKQKKMPGRKRNTSFLISCLTVGIIFLIWIAASAAGMLEEAKVVPSISAVWSALTDRKSVV